VERPLRPLESTVAVLNMDMIGRSEEVPEGGGPRFNGLKIQTAASNAGNLNLLGYSYSPELSAAADAANRAADLRLLRRYDNNKSNLLRRSDQWPFLQRGVPALFFHTGLHPDYHTQYDRPEKIDYAKMERVARLVHQLSWDLAQSDRRPKFAASRAIPPPE
jgi:Zn-dependent M28 family amino/carboxypeptidase